MDGDQPGSGLRTGQTTTGSLEGAQGGLGRKAVPVAPPAGEPDLLDMTEQGLDEALSGGKGARARRYAIEQLAREQALEAMSAVQYTSSTGVRVTGGRGFVSVNQDVTPGGRAKRRVDLEPPPTYKEWSIRKRVRSSGTSFFGDYEIFLGHLYGMGLNAQSPEGTDDPATWFPFSVPSRRAVTLKFRFTPSATSYQLNPENIVWGISSGGSGTQATFNLYSMVPPPVHPQINSITGDSTRQGVYHVVLGYVDPNLEGVAGITQSLTGAMTVYFCAPQTFQFATTSSP